MSIRHLPLALIVLVGIASASSHAAESGTIAEIPSGHAMSHQGHNQDPSNAAASADATSSCHTSRQQQSHACGMRNGTNPAQGDNNSGMQGMGGMHGMMGGGMHGMMGGRMRGMMRGMGCGMMGRQAMMQSPDGALASYVADSANGRIYHVNARQAELLTQYVWKQGLVCLNCHTVADPAFGPPFSAVAAFYEARPDANNVVASHITYGFGRMPAGMASSEQAETLAKLILALSKNDDELAAVSQ